MVFRLRPQHYGAQQMRQPGQWQPILSAHVTSWTWQAVSAMALGCQQLQLQSCHYHPNPVMLTGVLALARVGSEVNSHGARKSARTSIVISEYSSSTGQQQYRFGRRADALCVLCWDLLGRARELPPSLSIDKQY
jgi:hypothetical protein